MSVITICSDWNGRDYYLGALKGRLLSLCEGAEIVDLSQNIESYNISQAAFIVKMLTITSPKEVFTLLL